MQDDVCEVRMTGGGRTAVRPYGVGGTQNDLCGVSMTAAAAQR